MGGVPVGGQLEQVLLGAGPVAEGDVGGEVSHGVHDHPGLGLVDPALRERGPGGGEAGVQGLGDPPYPRGRICGSPNASKSSGPNVVISAISSPSMRRRSNLNARNSVSPGRLR